MLVEDSLDSNNSSSNSNINNLLSVRFAKGGEAIYEKMTFAAVSLLTETPLFPGFVLLTTHLVALY